MFAITSGNGFQLTRFEGISASDLCNQQLWSGICSSHFSRRMVCTRAESSLEEELSFDQISSAFSPIIKDFSRQVPRCSNVVVWSHCYRFTVLLDHVLRVLASAITVVWSVACTRYLCHSLCSGKLSSDIALLTKILTALVCNGVCNNKYKDQH